MLAAIYNGNKKLEVCNHILPTLEFNELLIKVDSCGICGTDKHIFSGSAPSSIPIILGHEYSGTIVDIGSSSSQFKIGDKVAVDPNIHCGYCNYCRKGNINFCENLKALGVTLNGGFAEYSIVPSSQAYILPNDFDLSIASFSEPLSCCLRGIKNAEIKPGNSVVIIGGGSIGLLMVQLVKNCGAAKVILIEPDQIKRALGLELGVDFVFEPKEERLFDQIGDLVNGHVDVIIECVGHKNTIDDSIKLAGKGGKVVIFGLTPADQSINLNLQYLFHKELKIINSYLNPFTFQSAVDLLVNKKIEVLKLITQQISLEEIPDFFSNHAVSNNIKVQLINNQRRSYE
jgi:2-desacetyl-2-hydroxyethyl bacteriochlorophyllide A dehydrogenase